MRHNREPDHPLWHAVAAGPLWSRGAGPGPTGAGGGAETVAAAEPGEVAHVRVDRDDGGEPQGRGEVEKAEPLLLRRRWQGPESADRRAGGAAASAAVGPRPPRRAGEGERHREQERGDDR